MLAIFCFYVTLSVYMYYCSMIWGSKDFFPSLYVYVFFLSIINYIVLYFGVILYMSGGDRLMPIIHSVLLLYIIRVGTQ